MHTFLTPLIFVVDLMIVPAALVPLLMGEETSEVKVVAVMATLVSAIVVDQTVDFLQVSEMIVEAALVSALDWSVLIGI